MSRVRVSSPAPSTPAPSTPAPSSQLPPSTRRPMVNERDLEVRDGRRLHIYDTRADVAEARLTVFWHHGTPNLGEPPAPLLPTSPERGIRCVSHDRPGYGGSTPHQGRNVASSAADVAAI